MQGYWQPNDVYAMLWICPVPRNGNSYTIPYTCAVFRIAQESLPSQLWSVNLDLRRVAPSTLYGNYTASFQPLSRSSPTAYPGGKFLQLLLKRVKITTSKMTCRMSKLPDRQRKQILLNKSRSPRLMKADQPKTRNQEKKKKEKKKDPADP